MTTRSNSRPLEAAVVVTLYPTAAAASYCFCDFHGVSNVARPGSGVNIQKLVNFHSCCDDDFDNCDDDVADCYVVDDDVVADLVDDFSDKNVGSSRFWIAPQLSD